MSRAYLMARSGGFSGIAAQWARALEEEMFWQGDIPDEPRGGQLVHNMSDEEIAERDQPVSRQERRQRDRLARKGRTPEGDWRPG